MANLKRYACVVVCVSDDFPGMTPDENGTWVKFDDVVAQNSTAPNKSSPKLPELEELTTEFDRHYQGVDRIVDFREVLKFAYDYLAGKIGL